MNPEIEPTPEAAPEAAPSQPEPKAPAPVQAKAEEPPEDAEILMRRLSRRSFIWAAVAGASTLAGIRWLDTRRPDGGIPWPLRRVLDTQGEIARDLYSTARLAPTFPVSMAKDPPSSTSYDIGLDEDFDPATWKLNVSGLFSGEDLELTLADIKKLPRTEIVTELKCIEGWSVIVHWAGVKFSDFMKKYPPATVSGKDPDLVKRPDDLVPFVGAQTPDGTYYVGLDMQCCLHPQTLLCYEMSGKPLNREHGAPLRVVTPTKYGIKHLKRLGNLQFTNIRPADYWAEQGYDWYSGH